MVSGSGEEVGSMNIFNTDVPFTFLLLFNNLPSRFLETAHLRLTFCKYSILI